MARLTKSGATRGRVCHRAARGGIVAAVALASLALLAECSSRRPWTTPGATIDSDGAMRPADPTDPEPAPGQPAAPEPARGMAAVEEGIASWYGPGFDGKTTANGETYDQDAMTAAHPSLPFGTRVRVTLVATGRSVIVRINDRGPRYERAIDLSRAAGRALGLIQDGIAEVKLEVLR